MVVVLLAASALGLFAVTLKIAFDGSMNELRGILTSVVAPDGSHLSTVINVDAREFSSTEE
jgi:hypothetical protein